MNKLNLNYLSKFVASLIIVTLIITILFTATDNLNYEMILSERLLLIKAFFMTLKISIITLVISMITGFGFYICISSENIFLKTLSNLTKEVIMGTPLLVMIFLVVYVFGVKLNIHEKLPLGIIALTIYMTPYIANSYKTASSAIDNYQYTVMDFYNFNFYQKYRYIIIPQMIKPLIPSAINNLSSIVKGSALLKIVSVSEISYVITVISNKNYAAIEGYLIMWMMYLIITLFLSFLANYIGRRCSN